jgi:hypothetical protein
MSQKNQEPRLAMDAPHQSLFRLKNDIWGSDRPPELAGILDEVRAEALVYGIRVAFDVNPELIGSPESGDISSEEANAVGTSVPQQAQEILNEILTKHYLKLCDALNSEHRARGLKPLGDPAKLAKQKADFEKAYYGRLRHSEKGRMAVDLLRAWRGAQIAQQRGWSQVTDSGRIAELGPFLHAVRTLDVEFFKLLWQAAQMLDTRIRSSKNASIGTGDTYIDMQLLIYAFRIAGTPTHTARELNEQFVKKFCSISGKKLREKCKEFGIPLKKGLAGRPRRDKASK